MYIPVPMHVCMRVCVCMYERTYARLHVRVRLHMYVYMHCIVLYFCLLQNSQLAERSYLHIGQMRPLNLKTSLMSKDRPVAISITACMYMHCVYVRMHMYVSMYAFLCTVCNVCVQLYVYMYLNA